MTKDHIHEVVTAALKALTFDASDLHITSPSQESFGDYSTSIALQLAKTEKKNPMDIANQIAKEIEVGDLIEKVEVLKPGFINFWISKSTLSETLNDIDDQYGDSESMSDQNIIVEFSSPNIAKPFTVGHLRSTIIGNSIANLFESQGSSVFRDNHLGDWGTQFGKQIYAIKNFGENIEAKIENAENPVKELVELYIKFHEEAEKNPELDDEARKWFKKLEEGDAEARRLWQECIDWSWKEFDAIYKKLNISFTENDGRGYGESFFEDKMQIVIDELRGKKFMKASKGAELVFFPDDKLPPLMIMKQDGATLYATRDLATDYFRLHHPKYGKNLLIINEVGAEQALYFRQLYEVEKMLGWVSEGQRVHVKHGMYRFKDFKMSTRKGNVIWLSDVLDEAVKRAQTLSKIPVPREISQEIAFGALKWNDLKRSSHLDIVFDWDEILSMQGNSGPYVQYTYVRCKSILAKRHTESAEGVANLPAGRQGIHKINEEETAILRALAKYPEVVHDAAKNYAPNYITTYLYELAQKYNFFYQKHQILKEENEKIRTFRIRLTEAVSHVLKHGLNLLGIQTVEKM